MLLLLALLLLFLHRLQYVPKMLDCLCGWMMLLLLLGLRHLL